MNTSKIIKGVVNNGRYTVTAPIVKEDYGLYLQIEGVELPPTYEVDFSNSENSGTSVTMIGNSDGVLIPNQFIASGKDVFAFLYHVGDNYGRTVFKFHIPNKLRPDRTNEQPTPEQQSTIDQAIAALNDAVEQTAQDVIDAGASAQSASRSAENAHDSAVDAQNYAESAQTSATQASASAESASASASASANSASQSAQIKADVEDLAEDAQASANASAQSATASANSASQAQGFANSASASAQSASGYASSAQTSANTASSKAEEASGYAQTASQKATESAQSASQALTYKTDAESAKTASQTAQGLAEGARDSAISAKNDAEQAKADAESARDEAQQAVASISGALADKADIITDTASGSIASFSDGADGLPLKSLVVDINPIQDLSNGDPSPENICPISGWTQVGVEQSGKNLLNISRPIGTPNPTDGLNTTSPRVMDTEHYYVGLRHDNYYYPNNIAEYSVANNEVTVRGTNNAYGVGFPISVKPNTQYKVSATVEGNGYLGISYYDAEWNYISFVNGTPAFTTPSNASYAVILLRSISTSATATWKNVQVELGSTATEYEPYTGRSITIDLGQTVYGGKLDVLSGVLVAYPYYASYNGETLTGRWVSDRDKYVSGTTPTIGAQVVNIGAQGVTVQLEPHEVESLYGVNNLWADSGDTEVEYRADTKLYIQKKIAEAISALS